MRFAVGIDDDLGRVPRPLPRRPGDRARGARPAVAARAPQPGPVGDADVGDHRAADRHAARGRDPAPDDRRARPPRGGPARLAVGGDDRGLRAGRSSRPAACAGKRALAMRRAAREVASGASRRRCDARAALPRTLAAAARDPGDRDVDGRDARAARARAPRRRPRRRPRLPQARRAPDHRSTRRRSPTRPRCAGSSPPTRPGPASPAQYLIRARTAPSPSPGRNSLVSGGASEGGRLSSLLARIQRS